MVKLKKTATYAGIAVVSLSLLLGACGQAKDNGNNKNVEHTYKDTTKDDYGFKGTIRKMKTPITVKQEKEFMVYIFATSCPHCAKFKSVINEYAQKKTAMNVYAYDLDNEDDIESVRYFYNLYGNEFQGTPTLLHIKNGELVNEYIGEQPLENIPSKTLDLDSGKNNNKQKSDTSSTSNSGSVSSSQANKLTEGGK